MLHYFTLGGWSMWFVLACGVVSVIAGAGMALRGSLALKDFLNAMVRTTLMAASFGFIVGMINVAEYIEQHATTTDQRISILIEGTKESSTNLAMALLFVTFATFLLAVAERRCKPCD
jgi:hypothetical protein